jgi:hypothetical protein
MRQADPFATSLMVGFVIVTAGCAVGSRADLGAVNEPNTVDVTAADAAAAVVPDATTQPQTDDGGGADVAAAAMDGGASLDGAPMVDAGPCSFAGTLASFDLTSLSGVHTSVGASSTSGAVTASALESVGITGVSSSGAINASGWPAGGADATKYYAFRVTPPAGCKLSATTLSIDLKASSSGPASAGVATSVDAFASLAAAPISGAAVPVTLVNANNLSNALELRVYGFGAASATGTLRLEKTLSLSGSLSPM